MANYRNVLEFLDGSARKAPDKVAFADEANALTFAELADVASRIGTALARRVGAGRRPIAVAIDRNVESIACFMGVVASGNYYVPLDTAQPPARLQTILRRMEPAAILLTGKELPEGVGGQDTPVLDYRMLAAGQVDEPLLAQVRAKTTDADPLYAIFTSGSTGEPKGVLVPHRAVLDFIPVFAELFSLDGADVFGNQAPFDFDVSVKDIYSTLYLGATMHVIPRKCFVMPKLMIPFLEERGITTLVWAVSALCVLSGLGAFKAGAPSGIRQVMFSGEAMPVKHLNIWRRWLPEARFVNLYGPTEVTCNCMYYVVDREFADDERLPLGSVFPNESVYVLGADDRPVTPGQTGEICVCGTCLALGYCNDLQRTAESFVQNPLNTSWPELMYRTGDLAVLRESGEYEFAGRKDFQIKHMGHRIELEEIELHMGALDGVGRACCFLDEKRNKIVACYSGELASKEVAVGLSRKLPKYMLPNVYHEMDELPLSKNGKVDRRKLREEFL